MSTKPKHVAIIMDGNGRWARRRGLPRFMGHKSGVDAVHRIIDASIDEGIECLTLWAMSQENLRSRPKAEVKYLLNLLESLLSRKLKMFCERGVALRFVGDLSVFPEGLGRLIEQAERLSSSNTVLKVNIALNYSGRWQIVESMRRFVEAKSETRPFNSSDMNVKDFDDYMAKLSGITDPDLLIRTGGERRLSNFMLWQLCWTELYFSDLMWPEFTCQAYQEALDDFSARERRYGLISEQLHE